MNDAAEKLLDVLDKATDEVSKITDRGLIKLEPRCEVSAETKCVIKSRLPSPLISKEKKKKLQELCAAKKRAVDMVMTHTSIAAKKAYNAGQLTLAERVKTGKSLAESDGWTVEEMYSDYAQKMEAGKEAARQICAEIIKETKEPLAKYITFCNSLANEISEGERALAEEFYIPYQPSNIVFTIRAAGNEARNLFPSNPQWGNDTKDFLAFLDLD